MKTCQKAFTITELLLVVFLSSVLGFLYFSASAKAGRKNRIPCVTNLKQVGLAFRLWSGDNDEQFPMQAVTTNGIRLLPEQSLNPASIFQILSNELNSTKILICPLDKTRQPATNFAELANHNVSYFVGLDAREINPQTILSGDRNITNGLSLQNGILEVTTNHTAGWTHEIHQSAGNIGLADGSVQQVTIGNLRKAVAATGLATNRLAMP